MFGMTDDIRTRWQLMEDANLTPAAMLENLARASHDVKTLLSLVDELREDNARLQERNAQLSSLMTALERTALARRRA